MFGIRLESFGANGVQVVKGGRTTTEAIAEAIRTFARVARQQISYTLFRAQR